MLRKDNELCSRAKSRKPYFEFPNGLRRDLKSLNVGEIAMPAVMILNTPYPIKPIVVTPSNKGAYEKLSKYCKAPSVPLYTWTLCCRITRTGKNEMITNTRPLAE